MATQFGLLTTGFSPKRQQDVISELQTSLQNAFGQNVNLLPESVFGQLVGIISERESLLWQLGEAVYSSQYPSGAEGTSVDNILALNNLKRLPAVATKTASNSSTLPGLVLLGTPGTVIPIGSLMSVFGSPTSQFSLDSSVTIGSPVNAVQNINFSSTPASGSFNLSIVDANTNTLTTSSIPWSANANTSRINFSAIPITGFFTIRINGETTAGILFSDSAATVQSKIQALPGFSGVTVSGTFGTGFVINWGTNAYNPILVFPSNSLGVSITSIDSVQAEINALIDPAIFVTTTGSTTSASNLLTAVTSTIGIVVGQTISGIGIPGGTIVLGVAGNVVTMSANATATSSSVALTFTGNFPYTDVAVTGTFGTGFVVDFGAYSPTSGNAASGNQPQNLMTAPINTLLNGGSTAVNIQVVNAVSGLQAQAIGSATCTVTGPTFAPANTITVINSPVSGWTSVTNPLDAITGSDLESDTAALQRRATLLASQANGPLQSIIEKVLLVNGVSSALGFENLTGAALQTISFSSVPVSGSFSFLIATQNSGSIAFNATSAQIQTQIRALGGLSHVLVTGNFVSGFTIDFNGDLGGQPQPLVATISNTLGVTISYGFGRPGNSFEIVAEGGANSDVANAIYGAKPAGILTYGNQSVTVTDSFGNNHVISFSRPTVAPVYISINLIVKTANFPLNGVQTIQQDLVTIGNEIPIGGTIVGFGSNGLVGAFNSVPGIVNYTIAFGLAPSPSTNTNVQLLPEQVAQFETFNITINVTNT